MAHIVENIRYGKVGFHTKRNLASTSRISPDTNQATLPIVEIF